VALAHAVRLESATKHLSGIECDRSGAHDRIYPEEQCVLAATDARTAEWARLHLRVRRLLRRPAAGVAAAFVLDPSQRCPASV